MYCLNTSLDSVLQYLDFHDPSSAIKIKEFYSKFGKIPLDPLQFNASFDICHLECQKVFKTALMEIIEKTEIISNPQHDIQFRYFEFLQKINRRIIFNSDRFYQSMYHSKESTWANRDAYFFEAFQL